MKRIVPALAALLLCACAPAQEPEPEVTRRIFEAGERFAGYEVTAPDGEPTDIALLPGGRRLVLYLSATCGDCIAEFESYELLDELYPGEAPLSFLWQTAYPAQGELALGDSYLVPAGLRLGDLVPTYFLLDEGGTILHKSIELREAVAAFAAETPPEENARAVAGLLARKGDLLLTETAPENSPEHFTVVDCSAEGLPEGIATLRDSAGILPALSGVGQLPALLTLSPAGELLVTAL